MPRRYKEDELVSVEEAAEAIGRKSSTIWILARDHGLTRYRLPARGKTTLFRWGDIRAARETPRPKDEERRPAATERRRETRPESADVPEV